MKETWGWLKNTDHLFMAAGCAVIIWIVRKRFLKRLVRHVQSRGKSTSASINNETRNFACLYGCTTFIIHLLFFPTHFSLFFQSGFDFTSMTVWTFLWWRSFVQLLKPAPKNVISVQTWIFLSPITLYCILYSKIFMKYFLVWSQIVFQD